MPVQSWNMLSFAYGTVALVARGDLLCRICFTDSPEAARLAVSKYCPDARRGSSRFLDEVFDQLNEYFQGTRKRFSVKLDDTGLSDFSRNVQQALLEIPYGSVISYGELASLAGSTGAARAVGRVMSANPFPLVVPCHRVINADDRPGQYSGGFGKETKTRLIELERRASDHRTPVAWNGPWLFSKYR